MKVLILSSMYPNSKIYMSGVFVHEQVKELKKAGIEVFVIAPVPFVPPFAHRFSDRYRKIKMIPEKEIIEGVEIYHSRYLAIPGGIFKQYWGILYAIYVERLIRKHKLEGKFDIIHAHGSSPDDVGAKIISEKTGIPYILTVHGDSVYKLILSKRKFSGSKKAIESASAVIGVSSVVVERIRRFTSRTKNIFCVHNGFSEIDSRSLRQKSNKKLNILFAATLIERKGLRYLIEAVKLLKEKRQDFSVTVAGGGDLLDSMRNLAIDNKVSEFFEFKGTVAHNDMLELMSLCDIFVLPSWDEAFGVVYLEAMSFRKPVIGTSGEGIADVIRHGVNGLLVEPKNSDDLAEKIELLISDENLRNDLGKKGYLSIKEMTWSRNASLTTAIYREASNNFKIGKI
ncbi:MAG: glycosyltransferase [Ignavibacteriales bacterium]|nr:glycosyltransferase [Ignavibacteriales bacterium]MCF8315401.1 glycosyltransferase [Ignavibacteriales bacterium]MCF8436707.1 glycosyltransferase [Ignavibacteriales bacterium]